ncbi:Arm DNA-binding domain-containing protein [Pseudoalteromonas atlantica]|uniref:Arm DNA-binding domain-containing protein n=1 Tax=Pseudoalteromonas atlantica TaxID=288 RepID=UPI003A97E909
MSDLELPKGITIHRDKLRIAFRPPNEKHQWKRSLGIPPTKANIKAAEQMLNAIRRDISLGQFDLAQYFPNDPSLKKDERLLGAVIQEHFIKAKKGRVKGSTHNTYTIRAEWVIENYGHIDAANVTPKEAMELREGIISQSPSAELASFRLWLIRFAVTRAVRALVLEEDRFGPMLDSVESKSKALTLEGLHKGIDSNEVFTIEEAERIVKACTSESRKRLVTFLFWSGLRPGEAAALRREDICLPYIIVKRTLTQYGEEQSPKSGRARKIYLPSSARLALEQELLTHDSDRAWVTSMGKPYTSSRLFTTKHWKGILDKAGLAYLAPYTTRHSFASWMLKAGEPESTVAAHLGHTDTAMIRKVYGKFIPDAKPVWTLDDPTKIEIVKNSMISNI